MALLYMDGFDAQDVLLRGWMSGGANITYDGGTRWGTGSALHYWTGGGQSFIQHRFPASTKTVIGFAIKMTNAGVAQNETFLMGDTGSTVHLTIQRWTSNTVRLTRGDPNAGGTVLATSAGGVWDNNWHYMEISATIADSGGTCIIHMDNTEVINFTGDTKNGGTNSSLDTFASSVYSGNDFVLDDLYILDGTGSAPWNDFLGDSRIHTLVPTGAGSNTQLTPSTGANWSCVDELPYSTSDYVTSSTAGQKDTYATSDLPGTVGTVYGVQLNAIAKKTDAGSRALKTTIRRGSTDYSDSTATNLASGDVTLSSLRTLDPSTSAQWTTTNVNAMEIGVEVA